MNGTETCSARPSLRTTKVAAVVACVFLLPAVALSPGSGSSLGIQWPVFFCTWGITLVAALATFVGYFSSKRRGEPLSVFYVICPALLLITLLVFWNLSAITPRFAS